MYFTGEQFLKIMRTYGIIGVNRGAGYTYYNSDKISCWWLYDGDYYELDFGKDAPKLSGAIFEMRPANHDDDEYYLWSDMMGEIGLVHFLSEAS